LGLILIRKALDPETTVTEVLVVVVAFVILIVARKLVGGKKEARATFSAAIDDLLSNAKS